MRYFFAILALGCLWMASCNNDTSKKEETATEAPAPKLPPQSRLDDAGTQKLVTLIGSYYELKDAMVAADPAKADASATKLIASANDLEGHIKTDSINRNAILPYMDTLKDGSNAILSVTDPTCEKKRIPFEKISDAMYGLLKTVDMKNAGVYREYCPMAFNDKGAYWLSAEAEIKNPYFGKKMLECGEVTDSLK